MLFDAADERFKAVHGLSSIRSVEARKRIDALVASKKTVASDSDSDDELHVQVQMSIVLLACYTRI